MRTDNLSFGHHAEVASLDPEEQDYFLDLTEKNEWVSESVESWRRRQEIAESIKTSSRKDNLSHSHHKEVASLDPEEQAHFLLDIIPPRIVSQ